MSKIRLVFVANDGNTYASHTEIGKQLGFVTWPPSPLRIYLPNDAKAGESITLKQECIKPIIKNLGEE